jgi:hypothetical protein
VGEASRQTVADPERPETAISTIFVEPETVNGVELPPAGFATEEIVAETEAACDPKLKLGFPRVGAETATLVAPAGIVIDAVSLEIKLTWATGGAALAGARGARGATYFVVVTESEVAETFDVPSAVVAVTVNEYVVSSERLSIVKLSSPQV